MAEKFQNSSGTPDRWCILRISAGPMRKVDSLPPFCHGSYSFELPRVWPCCAAVLSIFALLSTISDAAHGTHVPGCE